MEKNNKVVLFGVGGILESALRSCKEKNLEVIYLSCNDKALHNTYIHNILVLPPEQLGDKIEGASVLIASMYAKEIALQLESMGIDNFRDFSYVFDENRWKGHFDISLFDEKKINEAKKILGDDESKEVFQSILDYRKSKKPSHLKNSSLPEYFHSDIYPKEKDTIIDGGAFNGDSAFDFCKKIKNCTIFCFEPDENSFKALKENVSNWSFTQSISCENYGLSNKKDTLYFKKSEAYDMQHMVSEKETNIKIMVTDLDSFVKEEQIEKVDFIKMDIEGSECKALIGCSSVILRDKPRLAICAYHLTNDLWEIPLLISNLNKDYKIYMLHHSQNLFETIIYAI